MLYKKILDHSYSHLSLGHGLLVTLMARFGFAFCLQREPRLWTQCLLAYEFYLTQTREEVTSTNNWQNVTNNDHSKAPSGSLLRSHLSALVGCCVHRRGGTRQWLSRHSRRSRTRLASHCRGHTDGPSLSSVLLTLILYGPTGWRE